MIKWILLSVLLFVVTGVAQAIPNPSAVYCTLQGYEYEIRTDEQGNQYGVCVFPDGSECDAWNYYCKCEPNGGGCWPGDFSCHWPCEEMRCKEAGESVLVSKCCEGLDEIYPAHIFDDNCNKLALIGWLFLCSDCGNGICESWESKCNCPDDCAQPCIIYVDDDSPGANDGSSWADAYNDLQDALAFAYSGDEIRVAQGIYTPAPPGLPDPPWPPDPPGPTVPPVPPTGPAPPPPLMSLAGDVQIQVTSANRAVTFQLKHGVIIKGGYAGAGEPDPNARDIELYETILSGDLSGNDVYVNDPRDLLDEPTRQENSYHVVTGGGTDDTAVLDGFTITAGNANGSWSGSQRGGAMWCWQGKPTVKNCVIQANSAKDLGGGLAECGRVENCLITQNSAGHGGGLFSCRPVRNCVVTHNSAEIKGGGLCNCGSIAGCIINNNFAGWSGGGLETTWPIHDCTVNGNYAGFNGGGISVCRGKITNSLIMGNRAGISGGGVFSCSTLTNCIFSGNRADEDGGGMFNRGTSILTNCTFSGNSAGDKGGGIYVAPPSFPFPCSGRGPATQGYGGTCTITNCILWENRPQQIIIEDHVTASVVCGNVQGGWPGEGNIDADPCFVQLGYWEPGPPPESPQPPIPPPPPPGSPSTPPPPPPNNEYYTWVEGDYHLLPDSPCINAGDPNYVAEPNETDLDGRPRVISGRIDMGAYEYSPPIPAEARIVPRTINLASKGKWIIALLWLPEDYNVVDIDPNSLLLEHEIEPEQLWVNEEKQVVMARFSRKEVQAILSIGQVELTITGQLMTDGTVFEATDVITVIVRGSGKSDK